MMVTTALRIGKAAGAGLARIGHGTRRLATGAAIGLAVLLPALSTAQAQGSFAPVARIDGDVVTGYELSQRIAFLTLLNAPGDIRALAMDQLLNERIQMREARAAGIVADSEAVAAGMEEFAARGSLTSEQLLQLLAQNGIAPETFRDFVAAGVTWRDFSGAMFAPRAQITEDEIDQAMAGAESEAGLRVLMIEISLPAGDPASRKASLARAKRLVGLDEDAFGMAAQRFSIGPSRNNRGKMKWIDVTALPPAVGAAVRGLRIGQTSRIIEDAGAVKVYFMADKEEVRGGTPATMVEYAALTLAGGRTPQNLAEAQKISNRVTSCDDLYPIARGLSPEQLVREDVLEAQLPAAYRAELDKLDRFEVSTATAPSGNLVVLMLCNRGNAVPRSLTRETVENQLRNRRIGTLAQAYLETIRANSYIEIIGN